MAEDDPNEAEGAAETARRRGAESVAAARERFQKMGDDMQGRYRQVSDDVKRGAERASAEIRRGAERAKESYSDVADNARRGYDKVRSDAGDLTREVGFFVRDNPAKALLIAAGVGFLLGLVARGRGDDDDV
ncbi:MAG: hypothetical protein QOH06_1902 [Acidobacteriota bacterium]|jgi:ElaB/YqjD/DUF883 family membrane-anchored ribosome-binding protein|nr:hypothetical protein [Acidobacteriota bacterium]